MPAKAPPEAPPARSGPPATLPAADVRSSRIYLFSRGPLQAVLRRTLSIGALVVLDVVGLALGLYLALVLRQVVYGEEEIFWSLLWTQESEWLKFLVPITVLVFLQAGLYAPRERRAGPGRLVAAIVTVALIVLAFGLGTGYDFTTYGLIPTAAVACALAIGLLRAAYGSVSLEAMKVGGIRRRVVLVGDGSSLARLYRQLAAVRGGIEYEFVGVVSREGAAGLPLLGASVEDLAAVLESLSVFVPPSSP